MRRRGHYKYFATKQRIHSELAPGLTNVAFSILSEMWQMYRSKVLPRLKLRKVSGIRRPMALTLQKGGVGARFDFYGRMKSVLTARLSSSILDGTLRVDSIERGYWTNAGYADDFDREEVVRRYQEQIGQRVGAEIADIAESTKKRTAAIIANWKLSPDATMEDLERKLSHLYSKARAKSIGITESTWLNSMITQEYMGHYGIKRWIWNSQGDWKVCELCRGLHGRRFKLGDPMPPDASHPGCRCYPNFLE